MSDFPLLLYASHAIFVSQSSLICLSSVSVIELFTRKYVRDCIGLHPLQFTIV